MYLGHLLRTLSFLSLLLANVNIASPAPDPRHRKASKTTSSQAQPGATRTASAKIQASKYWAVVKVGIAKIDFDLSWDTGSERLLLCGVPGPKNPKNIYPLSEEQKKGKKFTISYGDGTTDSGVEVEDTVTIGGLAVQMTLSVSTNCEMGNTADGIIGLRLNGAKPNFAQAAASILKQPTFAMSMSLKPSHIVFGEDPDPKKYINEIKTIKSDKNWMVKDVTFTAGSTSVKGALQFDTGTSVTFLDESIVDAYHAQIKGATVNPEGSYNIPCSATNLPTLKFTEPNNPGYTHLIPGHAFLSDPEPAGMCFSLLQPTKGQWFVGWAFWSTHYTWFDTNSMTMQFAQDKPAPMPLPTFKEGISIKQNGMPPP